MSAWRKGRTPSRALAGDRRGHVTVSDTVALDGSRLENQATLSRTMSSSTW